MSAVLKECERLERPDRPAATYTGIAKRIREAAAKDAARLAKLEAENERLRAVDAMAVRIMRECNEALECPLCGADGHAIGEHEPDGLCAQLDAALNPGADS